DGRRPGTLGQPDGGARAAPSRAAPGARDTTREAPRRRPRARRDRPPGAPRDQGQPQPVARRRTNRDRVLQRRRADAALRAPHRRDCVTDVGDRQRTTATNARAAATRKAKAAAGGDYTAASIQVLEGLE